MATGGPRSEAPPRSRESGQGTVEWVGLIGLVSLLCAGLLAVGIGLPLGTLVSTIADKLVCAASLGDHCGGESELVVAYGDDLAALVRRLTPTINYEDGMSGLPVDYRECRSTECADGATSGRLTRSLEGQPVTEFTHVVDCRDDAIEKTEAAGADCSGDRAGRLYIQYWTYYANSRTLDGVPIAEEEGFHPDDWEGVQIRLNSDGSADERASSHNGYNYERSIANWYSDAGIGFLKDAEEWVGGRPSGGWGPDTGQLYVSGGSHAGAAKDSQDINRFTPHGGISLVPLEPIAVHHGGVGFAISAPWKKDVWTDPEADGTG